MTTEERKKLVKGYLGKKVTIEIDRPKGYVHKKGDKTVTYKVNYGFIPNVFGGDGEELDVYLLGVDKPVEKYDCRIIGIIYRKNDVEDKLVAAPVGMVFDQVQIAQAVSFAEKYYDTEVEPYYHRSCGAVVYRWADGKEEYLILRGKRSNKWTFPKGHMEYGESERETAVREVFEEAGFVPVLDEDFKEELHYRMLPIGEKTVVLFLSEYDGDVNLKRDEIRSYAWADRERAEKMLEHENFVRILKKAHEAIIRKHNKR